MSANCATDVVLRGIIHGAVDYLLKPVRLEELRNIWQHVVRRQREPSKDGAAGKGGGASGAPEVSGDTHANTDDKQDGNATDSKGSGSQKRKSGKSGDDGGKDGGGSGGKDGDASNKGNNNKRKKGKSNDATETAGGAGVEDNDDTSGLKKPRVVWSPELHQQFVTAVNQLGIDKAVPKRILDLMGVQGLTRENVASPLQKYRLYLKRLQGVNNNGTVPSGAAGFMTGLAIDGVGGVMGPPTTGSPAMNGPGGPGGGLVMGPGHMGGPHMDGSGMMHMGPGGPMAGMTVVYGGGMPGGMPGGADSKNGASGQPPPGGYVVMGGPHGGGPGGAPMMMQHGGMVPGPGPGLVPGPGGSLMMPAGMMPDGGGGMVGVHVGPGVVMGQHQLGGKHSSGGAGMAGGSAAGKGAQRGGVGGAFDVPPTNGSLDADEIGDDVLTMFLKDGLPEMNDGDAL